MSNKKNSMTDFWSKVDKDGPVPAHMSHLGKCWVWTAGRSKGYGRAKLGGRLRAAHRISWGLHFGEIPVETPFVLHRCDHPPCVNPSHLFLGTHADNSRDMAEKGRAAVLVGLSNGRTKLNDEMVREIRKRRAAGDTLKDIARDTPVCFQVVDKICKGLVWKHVE